MTPTEVESMRELLGVIAEALTLPHCVFEDRDLYVDLLRDRVAMVRSLARSTVELGRPDITVEVLRNQIADSPVTYRTREVSSDTSKAHLFPEEER